MAFGKKHSGAFSFNDFNEGHTGYRVKSVLNDDDEKTTKFP